MPRAPRARPRELMNAGETDDSRGRAVEPLATGTVSGSGRGCRSFSHDVHCPGERMTCRVPADHVSTRIPQHRPQANRLRSANGTLLPRESPHSIPDPPVSASKYRGVRNGMREGGKKEREEKKEEERGRRGKEREEKRREEKRRRKMSLTASPRGCGSGAPHQGRRRRPRSLLTR